jgi:hypothetical protein
LDPDLIITVLGMACTVLAGGCVLLWVRVYRLRRTLRAMRWRSPDRDEYGNPYRDRK